MCNQAQFTRFETMFAVVTLFALFEAVSAFYAGSNVVELDGKSFKKVFEDTNPWLVSLRFFGAASR